MSTEGEECSSTDIEDVLESHKGSHSRKRSISPAAAVFMIPNPQARK